MMEELGYSGGHYSYDDDAPDHNTLSAMERLRYADPDYAEDDDFAEDYLDRDREPDEHRLDYAEDDDAETDFWAQFGWRSKARRRRGRFVPPDTRPHLGAVFVRLADLQHQAPPSEPPVSIVDDQAH